MKEFIENTDYIFLSIHGRINLKSNYRKVGITYCTFLLVDNNLFGGKKYFQLIRTTKQIIKYGKPY